MPQHICVYKIHKNHFLIAYSIILAKKQIATLAGLEPTPPKGIDF
jgi:hypothetical protein